MDKPSFIVGEPYLDYFDVMKYLQEKYEFTHSEKRHFWKWILDDSMNDVHNGCFIYLPIYNFHERYYIQDIEKFNDDHPIVVEIINMLWNEYGKEDLKFYVSW
jgi:PII-like signaling protein